MSNRLILERKIRRINSILKIAEVKTLIAINARAIHVDTVNLSHTYLASDLPPPEELERKGFEITSKKRGFNNIVVANYYPIKIHEPRLKVIASEYDLLPEKRCSNNESSLVN